METSLRYAGTDIDKLTEAFVDRYGPKEYTPILPATSVLFSDIRSHRADVHSVERKKYSISFGDATDMGGAKTEYYRSGPSKLVDAEGLNGKTIQAVDQFRFIIDERQIRGALEKRSSFVEARNVGAGVDRGLEQKMNISADMINLLKTNAVKVKRSDGKLVYRLKMDYDDFLYHTNVGKNVKEDKHAVAKKYGGNTSTMEDEMIDTGQYNKVNEQIKLRDVKKKRGSVLKQEKSTKYSDLSREEINLNRHKCMKRQAKLMSSSRNISASLQIPRSELQGKGGMNKGVDTGIETGTMKGAVARAYFTHGQKEPRRKPWLKKFIFKWEKINKDLEVVYSGLFLMIGIAYTMMCKFSTEYLMHLIKKVFSRYEFFQRKKFMGVKFIIFALLLVRILYLDFFDSEENKT